MAIQAFQPYQLIDYIVPVNAINVKPQFLGAYLFTTLYKCIVDGPNSPFHISILDPHNNVDLAGALIDHTYIYFFIPQSGK